MWLKNSETDAQILPQPKVMARLIIQNGDDWHLAGMMMLRRYCCRSQERVAKVGCGGQNCRSLYEHTSLCSLSEELVFL